MEDDYEISLTDVINKHKFHIGDLYNEIAMRDVLIDKLKTMLNEANQTLNELKSIK